MKHTLCIIHQESADRPGFTVPVRFTLLCCLVHQAREVTSEDAAEAASCRVSPPSWTLYHGLDGPSHSGQDALSRPNGPMDCPPKTSSPGKGCLGIPCVGAREAPPLYICLPGEAPEEPLLTTMLGPERQTPFRGDSVMVPGHMGTGRKVADTRPLFEHLGAVWHASTETAPQGPFHAIRPATNPLP